MKPSTTFLIASAALVAGAGAATGITYAATYTDVSPCITAIEQSESLQDQFSDALDVTGDAIEHASTWDWDALDSDTAQIETMTPEVHATRDAFDTAAEQCRAQS